MRIALSANATGNVEDGYDYTIPITLTVAHTTKHINVTLPASLPVSVLDDKVLTADNLRIENHSDSQNIRIARIEVLDGAYFVASYEKFPSTEKNRIALRINGCDTIRSGALSFDESAFPLINAGQSIAIRYSAKVSNSSDVRNVQAANVVFTLRAE